MKQYKRLIYSLSFSLTIMPSPALPDVPTQKADATQEDPRNPCLEKMVDEALAAIRKEAPFVHEDALRIWKNFKKGSPPPNYTYRFWGVSLILWLKDHKEMVFDSEGKILQVFTILYRKGLISEHAALVLTSAAWSHLIYREGVPDWENRYENRSPEGREYPKAARRKISERET